MMSDVLCPDCLCRDQILKVLCRECDITLLDSIDSTSEWALLQAKSRKDFPFACFAEEQTQGRGRGGRAWLSPSNSNIYMSLAWKLDVALSELGALSIVIGMAVIRALQQVGIRQARLKWPNDVLVNDKKIAGILIETIRNSDGNLIVIIGIGLNYNWPGDSPGDSPVNYIEKPDQPWTDVVSSLKSGSEGSQDYGLVDRDYLAGLLLRECMEMCEFYPHNKESLLKEYRAKYDACLHESVDVTLGDGRVLHGVANGVTAAGEIRVLINEEEHVFNNAEISLRRLETKNSEIRKIKLGNVKPC